MESSSSSSESSIVKTRWFWRRRSYWNRYQYAFVCFVLVFVIAVPVLLLAIVVPNSPKSFDLPKTESLKSVTESTTVRGWAPHVTRNLRHYVLPNSTTTLMQPQWRCDSHSPYLIIIVNSAIQHDHRRVAIRDTWGDVHKKSNVTVYLAFLIGTSAMYPNTDFVQRKLLNESVRYGDMIQEPFVDTYYNLTLKSVFLLKWVHNNCPDARFIMKADDDLFINVHSLLLLLQTIERQRAIERTSESIERALGKNHSYSHQPLLLGKLNSLLRPEPQANAKWFAPTYMYPHKFYPNFLSGGASYVMSTDAVALLYTAALNISLFHLEDVFITGICARATKIIPRHHPAFSEKPCSIDPRVLQDTSVVSCYIKDEKSLRKVWADIQRLSLFLSESTQRRILDINFINQTQEYMEDTAMYMEICNSLFT